MVDGYMGKLLRVDLTEGKTREEALPEEKILRNFVGMEGLASLIVYKEVPPGVDALDPENRLVFMTGPLTGTSVPGASTYIVCGKSPATGFTITSAHSQGYFASQLKFSGYDGIVLMGRAEKPVYLSVHEGEAEINDAKKIWGKETYEAGEILKAELGKDASVAAIGPGGENLCRQACIITDKYDAAARGGLGSVMGSKNLKAVVVARGTKRVPGADKEEFRRICREWHDKLQKNESNKAFRSYGTALYLMGIYEAGDLPIKNWSTAVLTDVERLSGKHMRDVEGLVERDLACYGCPTHCKKLLRIKTGPYAGQLLIQGTYEDNVAWGSNIGVTDPGVASYGTELCNRLGLDCLETGSTVSLAIECFEKGIITEEDTNGITLRWGDHEAAFKLVEKIAKREDFGEILAEGTKRAADSIGKGAEKLALHVKNMSIPMHDYRAYWGYGLQYAVGSGGPIHEGGWDYAVALEQTGEIRPFTITKRGELVKKGQESRTFLNCLGICEQSTSRVDNFFEMQYKTLSALTGWNMDEQEARKVGIRAINLRRVFNLRHGLTPEDDTLPPRLLEAPTTGPARGHALNIKPMVRDYYKAMGWDEKTGKPLKKTLEELDLEELIEVVWK